MNEVGRGKKVREVCKQVMSSPFDNVVKIEYTHHVAHLVRDIASAPVTAEDAARGRAEREQERDERAQREPVRVSVLCSVACVVVALTTNTEEDHVDDPCNEGGE